jgi:peroxin-6
MLTRYRFTLHPTLSLPRVASRLPFTYTGADFYALCSDAMLKAVTRQASLVDSKIASINNSNFSPGRRKISTAYFFDHYATKEDVAVMVMEEDFMNAERELIPSVSVKELEHYQNVRAQFEKVEEKKDVPETNGKRKAIEAIPQRPRSKGKGKEKMADRKGKGKEKSSGAWDEEDDDEFYDDGVNGPNGYSSRAKGKGKGKTVDTGNDMSFRDEDDEGLY